MTTPPEDKLRPGGFAWCPVGTGAPSRDCHQEPPCMSNWPRSVPARQLLRGDHGIRLRHACASTRFPATIRMVAARVCRARSSGGRPPWVATKQEPRRRLVVVSPWQAPRDGVCPRQDHPLGGNPAWSSPGNFSWTPRAWDTGTAHYVGIPSRPSRLLGGCSGQGVFATPAVPLGGDGTGAAGCL